MKVWVAKWAAVAMLLTSGQVLLSSPANAETQSHQDRAGDVGPRHKPAKWLDIVNYQNTYEDNRLVLEVTVSKWSNNHGGWQIEWFMSGEDSSGNDDFAPTIIFKEGREPLYYMYGYAYCKPRKAIDGERNENTFTLSIPRRCLGGDEFGAFKIALITEGDNFPTSLGIDDANQNERYQGNGVKYAPFLSYGDE